MSVWAKTECGKKLNFPPKLNIFSKLNLKSGNNSIFRDFQLPKRLQNLFQGKNPSYLSTVMSDNAKKGGISNTETFFLETMNNSVGKWAKTNVRYKCYQTSRNGEDLRRKRKVSNKGG